MLLTPSALAQQGALNILLIGVDSADLLERSRSDSMILLKLDPHASEIRMVSFLRDLYVSVPGIGKMRLNAA